MSVVKNLNRQFVFTDSVTLDYLLRVSDSKIRICDFSNLFPLITGEGKR